MTETVVKDPKHPSGNQPERFPSRKRDGDPDPQPAPTQDDRNVDQAFAGKEHGEGNYQATKQYDDATRDFVRAGRVEDAARDAEPRTDQEAKELIEAEAQGRKRSKGEDASAKPASSKRKRVP